VVEVGQVLLAPAEVREFIQVHHGIAEHDKDMMVEAIVDKVNLMLVVAVVVAVVMVALVLPMVV
jgi:hypothetical protein